MQLTKIIRSLELTPLSVEGGYFHEIYRSGISASIPGHCCGTSIYYMLRGNDVSAWHMVQSDEIWYYHGGSPAVQLLLFADGHTEERVIGVDLADGQRPQSVIPAGTWQAAVLQYRGEESWGLFGAAVFPGFEYADFIPGNGADLAMKFPTMASRMRELGLA